MERDYRAAARVFKALCDPKRLAILEELRGGEKCACVLQEPMELTQSGLSYHMKVLCESGLVVKLLLELTTPVTEQGTPLE